MRTIKVTSRTRDEIATAFAAAFKDVKAAQSANGRVTQVDRMAPYKSEIMKLRRRGLSWTQIATGMSGPIIGEKTSARLLKRLFGDKPNAPQPPAPASA